MESNTILNLIIDLVLVGAFRGFNGWVLPYEESSDFLAVFFQPSKTSLFSDPRSVLMRAGLVVQLSAPLLL
jgi:hypothetical protein